MVPPDEFDTQLPAASSAGGFSQFFGLHPWSAFLTVAVDAMVFGGNAFSMCFLLPLGIIVAIVLGRIIYRIQLKHYGDSSDTALTKAWIIGLLTAIPMPLAPVLAVPCGVIGLLRVLRRR